MDLTTRYLGLDLPHPFMPGASPMVDDLDTVRRLEDAGAAAIVMHSLFEEQIEQESLALGGLLDGTALSEATSFLPDAGDFALGPEEYLEQVRMVREAVAVPVIGSLNGVAGGRWLEYAQLIAEAGADALELNVYQVAADPEVPSAAIEDEIVAMVEEVKRRVAIPVAVKLSPYVTALAHLARRLEGAGADGLVLFNRFYQADIDVDELEADRRLHLSGSSELLLRIRWLAILSSQLEISLASTGGVHTPVDAIKALMTGADAIQLVSVLLKRGPSYLGGLRRGVEVWLEEREYSSLEELKGSMSLARCPDPGAYMRANYVNLLQSLRGVGF